MADIGIALLGKSGHQFTPAEIAAAGGSLVFEAEPPSSSEDAVELIKTALRRGAQLVSIMFAPVALRVEAAVTALQLGLDVIVERPLALDSDQLKRLDEAANNGKARYWERATTPFDQPFLRIKQVIDAGALGEIVLIDFRRSYPWAEWRNPDESQTGGLVMQSASYGLDLLYHIVQLEVLRIRVSETSHGEPCDRPLNMAAVVLAELAGGAVASICVDYLNPLQSPWSIERIVIAGTDGRLEFDNASGDLKLTRSGGTTSEPIVSAPSRFLPEVISAINGETETVPEAASLSRSTRMLVAAREKNGANWSSYRRADGSR